MAFLLPNENPILKSLTHPPTIYPPKGIDSDGNEVYKYSVVNFESIFFPKTNRHVSFSWYKFVIKEKKLSNNYTNFYKKNDECL